MTNHEYTLRTLARLDPDFPGFAAALPPELDSADTALPSGLAGDVLTLLRAERPELSGWLDAQGSAAPPETLVVDPLAAVSVLAAVLFLLRSHIKVEGKHFSFEHKPMGDDLLTKVLDALKSLLGG